MKLKKKFYMDKTPQYKDFYPKTLSEYNVGTSGGYGGGAMAGGGVAANNWAGTFSSPQTSRRLKDYPAMRRYTYMNGNTVIGAALYDTITDDDLNYPPFTRDEMFTGFRVEMQKMEFPDKDVARPIIIKNLQTNPKFYSDLDGRLKSDKLEENDIMNQINPNELAMGTKIEHEHTQDDLLAKKIALDHLGEDPRYYSKLNAAGLEEDETPVNPQPVVTTIALVAKPEDSQSPLTSSGLGKGGQQKPLQPSKTDAPETKIVNNKNTIGYSKTQPLNPNTDSDPVNHFCGQIAGAMVGQDQI
jgi:hypothetical protein